MNGLPPRVGVLITIAGAFCLLLQAPLQAADTDATGYTLDRIFRLVVRDHPQVKAARKRISAQRGQAEQASLRPNPGFLAEAENFGGSGRFDNSTSLEQKYVLRYMIETWDKRQLRTEVAERGVDRAQYRLDATRLDALAQAKSAYLRVLAAQKRVELRRELLNLAEQTHETVSKQVEAGKVAPPQRTRARVQRSQARIALQRAKREHQAARKQLAASWGADSLKGRSVSGTLQYPNKIPSQDRLQKKLATNPVVKLAKQTIRQRTSAVDLAQARSVPNVTVGGGLKQHEFSDDHSFIINVSLPIPVFDRNQGNIREASGRLAEARDRLESVRNQLRERLSTTYEELQATSEELLGLNQNVIPGARDVYEASLKGFRAGKFDYLDVLDAQRTLFENRVRLIRSLRRYHLQKTQIERLTATLGGPTSQWNHKGGSP